jgi:hypothetical protein
MTMTEAEHAHSHDHDCNHNHGLVKRNVEKIEHAIVNKISNKRAQALTGAALRGMSFLFCPGDDLAAIGLQMYAAASGHAGNEHEHHTEHKAILSRRPRIAFATNTTRGRKFVSAELPLDVPFYHSDIPDSSAGNVKRHIEDIKQIQKEEMARLRAEKATRKAEKARSSFLRKITIGAIAVSLFGIFGAEEIQDDPSQIPTTNRTAPSSPGTQPDHPRPHLFDETIIEPGDSQWKIIEQRVTHVTGESNSAVVNAATHYTSYLNHQHFPDPDVIEAGIQLRVPSPQTIEKIELAVEAPDTVEPRFAELVKQLNAEATFYSKDSRTLLNEMQEYF